MRTTPTAPEIHAGVTTLPSDYSVRRTASYWAVIGPTGVFLVGRGGADPAADANRVSIDAHTLRGRLGEILDVVPFIDPLLVMNPPESGLACSTVEPDLLAGFLTSGPDVLSAGDLQVLRHHLPIVLTAMEADGITF